MDQSIVETASIITTALQNSSTSLPQFTRPTLIESPNFIEESLLEEPVVNDIIKNLYNVYIGYILSALQMNETVVGNRTVRDMLSPVSTGMAALEGFNDIDQLIAGFDPSVQKLSAKEALALPASKTTQKANTIQSANVPSHDKQHSMPISSGRNVEVKFNTGKDSPPISVMVQVRLNPRVVPTNVVEYIINQEFDRNIANRWLQYRSGEIRFFRDFVFGVDKLVRYAKALKSDESHALTEIMYHRKMNNANLLKRLMNAFKKIGGSSSYNLANSVMILDEETVSRNAKKAGFNFDKLTDRRRFFDTTYNLFIVLVDTRFSRATIYTNGLDQSASYSFNELKASASSDKMSIKDIMEYLSKNQMPKF